jgi:hypothetical protein
LPSKIHRNNLGIEVPAISSETFPRLIGGK